MRTDQSKSKAALAVLSIKETFGNNLNDEQYKKIQDSINELFTQNEGKEDKKYYHYYSEIQKREKEVELLKTAYIKSISIDYWGENGKENKHDIRIYGENIRSELRELLVMNAMEDLELSKKIARDYKFKKSWEEHNKKKEDNLQNNQGEEK